MGTSHAGALDPANRISEVDAVMQFAENVIPSEEGDGRNILLIGGHGKVALLAQPLLVDAGHHVFSVIRNPDHVDDVEQTGAVPVVADVEELGAEALADLMEGIDTVIWSAGAGGGSEERTYAVDEEAAIRSMDAAQAVGVRNYIMVSYWGARKDHDVPEDNSFVHYANAKATADAYLRSTDLDWVILKPGTLTMEPAGKAYFGDDTEPIPEGMPRTTSRELVAQVIRDTVNNLPEGTRRDVAFLDYPS